MNLILKKLFYIACVDEFAWACSNVMPSLRNVHLLKLLCGLLAD